MHLPIYAALSIGGFLTAYYALFSSFQDYDDEGYLMLTVRHLMDGHPLYDQVVTPYGPSYYLFKWGLHDLLRVPLTNDATRFVSATIWLSTATLCALTTWRLTRALPAAVLTYVATFIALYSFVNEPGHPQEMVALLVGAALLIPLLGKAPTSPWTLAALGMVAGTAFMVKVNAGTLLLLSLLGAGTSCLRWTRGRTVMLILVGALVTALPWLVMHQRLLRGQPEGDDQWFSFCAGLSLSAFAVWIISWRPEPRTIDLRSGLAMLVGFVLAAVVGVAFALRSGATLTGLLNCVVLLPRRVAIAFGWPPRLEPFATACATAAVVGALAATLFARRMGTRLLIPIKLAYGVLVIYWASHSEAIVLLSYAGSFAWIVLLRNPDDPWSAGEVLGRRVLAWVAVLQMAQAYPVAGSQVGFGTFALVPVAVVSLWDGTRALVRATGQLGWLVRWLVTFAALVAAAVPAAAAFRELRDLHASLVPLGLPGAERVRVDERRATIYRALTSVVRDEVDTFVCTIGLNSLYFWSGKVAPSPLAIGNDIRVFTEEQQHGVIRSLLEHPHGVLIFHPSLFELPLDSTPFYQDMLHYFQPRSRIGDFVILVQRTGSEAVLP